MNWKFWTWGRRPYRQPPVFQRREAVAGYAVAPEAPQGRPHPDDALHERIKRGFHNAVNQGHLEPLDPNKRFRISWVCGACDVLHTATGTGFQCIETVMYFVQSDFPVINVMDMAFTEMAAVEGADLSTDEGIAQASRVFKEFLKHTR